MGLRPRGRRGRKGRGFPTMSEEEGGGAEVVSNKEDEKTPGPSRGPTAAGRPLQEEEEELEGMARAGGLCFTPEDGTLFLTSCPSVFAFHTFRPVFSPLVSLFFWGVFSSNFPLFLVFRSFSFQLCFDV